MHHRAKLDAAQVKRMREMRESKPWVYSYNRLSQIFKCGESTVRDIVQYRTRRDVV